MAPAQALPGADEETASKLAVRPTVSEKANGNLMCANNCEDNAFYAEPSRDQRKGDGDAGDEEVNVLECDSGGGASELRKDVDPDATEHSSSFGDTFSGSGGSSETEVDSGFLVENKNFSLFDGSNRVFKKRRVTVHWRKFIRPIMWRCQWLELRMKELQSQVLIYDKELEAYKHEKQLQSKMVKLDNSTSRSVPLTHRSHRKQAMRRQKRKRNEETVDISSYMSNHNIFSYYENKRPETDIQSVDDDCVDHVDEIVNDDLEWSVLRFRRRDSSLEQILWDIESALSRVLKLRSHLSEVMCRNSMEISSKPDNFFTGDLPNSCVQSPSFSPGNGGDEMPVGALNTPTHHLSECELEEIVISGSAVSSYGDAAELDMLECTMGLFSATDIPLDQLEIAELCEDADDDVLINTQVAEEELQNFEKVSHAKEKPQEMAKEEAGSSEGASTAPEVSMLEPRLGGESADMPQPVLKPCYTGKKRGRKPKKRRRGGSVGGSGGVKNERVQKRRLG